MRRLLAAALTVGAVLGAQLGTRAPSSGAEAPATLTVAIPGGFAGCDPASPATTPATDAVLALVLPSSFSTGPLTVAVGNTAVVAQAEVVRLNPQTVVYTIATGARWPNGTAFSASDLVRTWQERRASAVVADLGYREIAYMHPGPSGTSVTVGFSEPYSDWESLFSLVVPASTHGARCALPSATLDPSIGPYQIAAATPTSITLTANPAWAGDAPAYRRVVVTTDPATPPASARGPRVAYLPSPSLADLQAITSTGAYTSLLAHTTSIVSLDFAVQGAAALSPSVRGAVAQLVDRAEIVAGLLAPIDYTTSPAVSHLLGQGQEGYLGEPGVPVADAAPPTVPLPGSTGADAYGTGSDPSGAATALSADGYVKTVGGWQTAFGQPLAVCLDVPAAEPVLAPVALALAAQLEGQGVHVARRTVPTVQSVVDDLRAGRCASGLVTRVGDGFPTHEAASWLAPSAPVPADLAWTGVNDATATRDARDATGMLNPIEAQPSWNAMDERLWDLMVGMPLYSPSSYEAWSPSIAGVLPCTSVAGFVGQVPALLPTTSKP